MFVPSRKVQRQRALEAPKIQKIPFQYFNIKTRDWTKMTGEASLPKAAVDRLGERLCAQVTEEDLQALDAYRRTFHPGYELVVDKLRNVIGIEVTGRPAKSTPAIIEKLKRSSMRLSQMQDIAGCRTVVADTAAQDELVARIQELFPATVYDRRDKPSHGYRAVHVVAKPGRLPIEVQVRTELQHLWAELSEKCADAFGMDVKHGGGHEEIRRFLSVTSATVADYEVGVRTLISLGERLARMRNNKKLESIPEIQAELTEIEKEYPERCDAAEGLRKEIQTMFTLAIDLLKDKQ